MKFLRVTLGRININSSSSNVCELVDLIYGNSCLELKTYRMCKDCYKEKFIFKVSVFKDRFI